MKRLLLSRVDLVLFVGMTVACELIVRFSPGRPCLLALLPAPILATAVFNGVRERFFPAAGPNR